MQKYAPLVVRIAMSVVFLWFGVNQLIQPDMFMGYLPNFLLQSDYAQMAIYANGLAEVILGTMLIVGFYTKAAALLLSLHLLSIIITLGYNDIAVRDLGLMLTTFSIFIGGGDEWTLDKKRQS